MIFSSHRFLFDLSTEIKETFYRWGDGSAHPQNLTPQKKNKDFIFVMGGKLKHAPGSPLI